jgi:mannose-6-phosphate isomerase-like protein (cupin superfamily)
MSDIAKIIRRADWAEQPDLWHGELQGLAGEISVIFYTTDIVGDGPKLHRHPYAEVFIIRQGRALFTVGERRIEAQAGDIVVGPANVPHRFVNLGPGRLEATDLHLAAAFSTEWLDEPAGNVSPDA